MERQTPIEKIPGYKMTDRGQEVLGPVDGPLETPVKEIESGPLYKSVEEALSIAEPTKINQPSQDFDRRDFLKLFGVSSLAATAASCIQRPLEKVIPYVNQPVDQAIGVPTNYATTCGECSSGCGLVVKTVSGLPVKIEGNAEHPVNQGGTCSVGQAALQGLFHPERRKRPVVKRGNRADEHAWDEVNELLAQSIAGKKVAIFTGGGTGHQKQFLEAFLKNVGSSADDLYSYDANPLLATMIRAHELAFGVDGIARPDLAQAQVICGIGSDFLDLGISSVFMAKSFSQARSPSDKKFAKFFQFESYLTQTGAKADFRYTINAGEEVAVAGEILRAVMKVSNLKSSAAFEVASRVSRTLPTSSLGVDAAVFDIIAKELVSQPSIVLSGDSATTEQGTVLQLITILINSLIGAYGKTLHIDEGWLNSPVNPGDLQRFIKNYKKYDAVFFVETNPVFNTPPSLGFEKIVQSIPLVISMQSFPNEMDRYAQFILNINHYLESWGDEEPVAGFFSARQPVVRTTTDSQQFEDVLMWVSAYLKKPMGFSSYKDYLKSKWQMIHKTVDSKVGFDLFHDAVLRRGFVGKLKVRAGSRVKDVSAAISGFKWPSTPRKDQLHLVTPLDPRLRDGSGAFKPLLHEIGDGISTIAWDSWLAMSPKTAQKLGFRRNDVIQVEGPAGKLEVALFLQPGLGENVVVLNRGNGHDEGISKISDNVGVNPLKILPPKVDFLSGEFVFSHEPVQLVATGKQYMLAAMQKSADIGNRTDIVKKISYDEAKNLGMRDKSLDDVPDLYPKLDEGVPYRWGMSIDLTKCTGCGACMAACATENNVPQVGRSEILKGREMHWIRLDRYYQGDLDNPTVTIQPMTCQQCTHAPCEAVCPVIATSHDPEGINTMTYNRCIGTRYCANACPYKVRRFNWWTHKWGVIGERMVDRNPRALNPDVTVRTRGVMEKCNFCAHRVKHAKFDAKSRGELIADGEVKTACEQVCPSNAIVFGNLKDAKSRVSRARGHQLAYLALGGDPAIGEYGIKTLPNISYMTQVSYAFKKADSGHESSGEHHG